MMTDPRPPARLSGKVAIVTGAGQGIGRAISERFAADGAAIVGTQRHDDHAHIFDRLKQAGAPVEFVAADVRNAQAVEALVGRTVERFGGIDVLVNNAAVGLRRTVMDTTDEEYDSVLDTNLRGIFLCCRYALPHLLARPSGSIINIGSVAASVGFAADAAYCASKGAVEALTKQMAIDYSPRGIRVNCIAPGFIETEQYRAYVAAQEDVAAAEQEVTRLHPIGRIGLPEEVAAVAAFLASDDASFVTGASWAVDGGLLASQPAAAPAEVLFDQELVAVLIAADPSTPVAREPQMPIPEKSREDHVAVAMRGHPVRVETRPRTKRQPWFDDARGSRPRQLERCVAS